MTPPITASDRAELIAECRRLMAWHARSFDRAARLLPPATRDRVAVLYAFCRIVDDSVDEAPTPAAARAAIEALEAEVRAASGRAAEPRATPRAVVEAFAAVLGPEPLAIDAALELIHGVASDTERVRLADDRALLRYCYQVAGAVGLMMCPVLGVTDRRALPHAIDLGIGMQLTNICRDVAEDASRDRVYLPTSRLRAHGVDPEALPSGGAPRLAVARVTGELLALADRYYASADAGMRYIPLAPRQAILAASRLYRAIGLKLRRRGCDPLAGRTVVGPAEKAAWLLRALVDSLRPRHHGLGRGTAHDASLHLHLDGLPGVAA